MTARGGSAILFRRGIVHHLVPETGLSHLEATAIQVTLVVRPVKILSVYLSPTRLLLRVDLTACFRGRLPVLMTSDLNATHVEWN
jgi:hypothetical protein